MGDFESFLAARDAKSGKFPSYIVKIREGNDESVRYFDGEPEVRVFHEQNLDLNLFEREVGQDLPAAEPVPDKKNGPRRQGQTD